MSAPGRSLSRRRTLASSGSEATGTRFEKALVYAARLHRRQRRKVTAIPYITHLLAVAAIVGENGGDEDQMIAALLHDAAEDQGGAKTLREIRRRFGPRVARLVEACTDTVEDPKPPWRSRKERYLRELQTAPADARLISAADKVHNLGSILRDLRREGEALWTRFSGRKEGTLWYYRSLAAEFSARGPAGLAEELACLLRAVESVVSAP